MICLRQSEKVEKMGTRRQSREMALQLLFQNEFGLKITPQEMLKNFSESFTVDQDVFAYARDLTLGIFARKEDVDGLIQRHSAHWKNSRMGLVDINVMRIATYEMKFMEPALPASVAINEAVEVAKKYGSSDSGSFVNGILDQIAKS